LEECIKSGQIAPCNVGLTTQLIKVMIDAWVMKGWDLRGRTDLAEMETTILNLLWNGLPKKGQMVPLPAAEASQLEGKAVLVVNGGTPLGTAIVSSLISKGACPTVYAYSSNGVSESSVETPYYPEKIRFYSSKDYGPLDRDLFKKIASDMKQMDIYIHDLGIGNTVSVKSNDSMMEAGKNLDANLICAQETADPLKEVMSERETARCIYLAPWLWDRYANPIHYEAVKGAAIALTNMMAKELSQSSANVHCIIPGYIRSERPFQVEEGLSDELIDKVPFLCLGDMSDVTNAVLFLSSDASKFLTGQVLHISRDHSDSGKRGYP
jgi:3-oxoacyl-[acyl-carrier protein] reductase